MSAIRPVDTLRTELGAVVLKVEEFRGEWTVSVKTDAIRDVCAWCKRAGFEMLDDLFGVDHYGDEERFEVVYLLLSLTHGYLRLKVRVSEANPVVPSVIPVYGGANWHEREAFDMYGIRFVDHPNLRRILMWEGYPFYPLRKDFPVSGLDASLPESADASAGTVDKAPMAGGPFYGGIGTAAAMVTKDGRPSTIGREPRQYDTGAEQLVKLRNPVRKEAV